MSNSADHYLARLPGGKHLSPCSLLHSLHDAGRMPPRRRELGQRPRGRADKTYKQRRESVQLPKEEPRLLSSRVLSVNKSLVLF